VNWRLAMIPGTNRRVMRRCAQLCATYLKQQVPAYTESAMYVDAPAVRDRGLITASGLADVEFAQEIMAELGVLSDDDRAYWTTLFRAGRLQG